MGRFNSIVKAYDSDKNDWLRNKKSELNDLGKVEELLTQEKNEIDKKNAGSHAKNELDSQLQDKKNEIKYVSQEIINANARTSTKFNELVGSSFK